MLDFCQFLFKSLDVGYKQHNLVLLNGKLEDATEDFKLRAKIKIKDSADKHADPWTIGALDHLSVTFQVSHLKLLSFLDSVAYRNYLRLNLGTIV